MAYARNWANRCVLEMQYSKPAWFVTLTYDDEHLPKTFTVDKKTGEALSPAATLRPRDLQLFMKLFRRHHEDSTVRFFAAGEYGDKTFRPHYHLIIFGSHCQLELLRRSPLGDNYYTSPDIEGAWPHGQHVIAPATRKTCAYVARYILKKQMGSEGKTKYDDLNIVAPFTRMSRRPGIGSQYFDAHPDCLQYKHISVGDVDGGTSFPAPPYYRNKLKAIDPASADWYSIEISSAAQSAAEMNATLLTDKDIFDILDDRERRALNIARKLPRPDF